MFMIRSILATWFCVCVVHFATVPELRGEIAKAVFHVEADRTRARIPFMSWDTEGGQRALKNLVSAGKAIELRIKTNGKWQLAHELKTKVASNAFATAYTIDV